MINSGLQHLSVLYVEDHEGTREDLKKFLKRRCGKVVTAYDGLDGIAKHESFHPDLIIADLIMPNLDGIEMARKIRERDKNVKIIITSSASEVSTVLEAVDVGIEKYIIKPIDLNQLEASIEKVASQLASSVELKHNIPSNKECETMVKKDLASFLKKYSGKGPKDISAFVRSSQIEIKIYDSLTLYERTLLRDYSNLSLVEQSRRCYYKVLSKELCQLVSSAFSHKVTLSSISVDLSKHVETLIFSSKASY